MNTNKELNYRLFLQHENNFTRSSYKNEIFVYSAVQSGDVETVKRSFEEIRPHFMDGKGKLSDDPVRNLIYHLIVCAALISRFCIEGGMSQDESYTLADIYIQKADKCNDYEKLLDIFEQMQIDYTTRMSQIKKNNIVSIHIRKCMDYIYSHLDEKITVGSLADYLKLNPNYLSKLFQKETGMNISEFIMKAKISTAENMLKYSDFSYLDISLALGFSTQSYFISSFKKIAGMTPKEYREKNYMKNTFTNKSGE